MGFHATARRFRLLLPVALLVLPCPSRVHGQRITYAGVPWGLPADSVRPRMEALGWEANGTNAQGDLLFRRDSVRALTLTGDGGLQQVNVVYITTPARREGRLRVLVDSLTGVYGPAATTRGNGAAWGGALSSLAATSMVTDSGASAVVALAYLGPGAQREHDRRAGQPDPFPPLTNEWIVLHRSGPRRMAVDTTAITALGDRVYRVRTRLDLAEPLREGRRSFNGLVQEHDYDCARRRTRLHRMVMLHEGRVVDELGQGRWRAVPDGPEGSELGLVCGVATEYLGR